MLNKALGKHVEIGIMNEIFEGFLYEVEEGYSKLILNNNEILFINNNMVCFVKVNSRREEPKIQNDFEEPCLEPEELLHPVRFCAKVSKKSNEFVMQTPTSESTYQVPTFTRSTEKE